jgi:hypothetical protein
MKVAMDGKQKLFTQAIQDKLLTEDGEILLIL